MKQADPGRARDHAARAGTGRPTTHEDPTRQQAGAAAAGRTDAMKDEKHAGPATAWLNQGNVHHERRRHSRARRAFEAAARIASVAGERYTQALALCNLGVSCHELGRDDEAKRRYEEALALQRELAKTDARMWYAMATTQRNLADMSFHRGDLSDAHKRIDEALTIFLQYLQQDGLRVLPEVVKAMALHHALQQ